MTAIWNIKGPSEQRITFRRLLFAYHIPFAGIYLAWILFRSNLKRIRRRRA